MAAPPTDSAYKYLPAHGIYRPLPGHSTLASVTPQNAGTNISVMALITDVGRPVQISLGHMQRLRLRDASTTREITVRLFHEREHDLFPYHFVGTIILLYGIVIVQELGQTILVSARPWQCTYVSFPRIHRFDCPPEWDTTYDYESRPETTFGMKNAAGRLLSWWIDPECYDWTTWYWRKGFSIGISWDNPSSRSSYRWDPERGEGEVVEFGNLEEAETWGEE